MVASHHFDRVDTLELKNFICRKIGKQRADKYFDQLKKFLSFKLSKAGFDESCIQTIGKENVPLHNLLIRSILQNACQAKVPPQKPRKVEGPGSRVVSGYQRTAMQSLYGDVLTQSPRKCRSPISREHKSRDRPSPLGPLGKSPSITIEETGSIQEPNAVGLLSPNGKPGMVEAGEEVEQCASRQTVQRWSNVIAPIGVSVNTCTSHKAGGIKHKASTVTCQSCGELPDTISLRSSLQAKLASEGVDISLNCVNLLNHSLDVFLKRLIEPCLGIAGLQHSNSQTISPLNGILRGRSTQRSSQSTPASMLDFLVAIELYPHILGHNRSIPLEKIRCSAPKELVHLIQILFNPTSQF